MSIGKVTLDGKEYEIDDVLDSDTLDNGRIVRLALVPVVGPNDREVYKVPVCEESDGFNVGLLGKGSADTVIGLYDGIYLEGETALMEPGTAIVIIRRGE